MDFSFIYVSDCFRFFLIKGNICNPYQLWNIAELYSMQSMKCLLLFALGVVPSSLILCPLIFILEEAKNSCIPYSPFLFNYLFYRLLL